MLSRAPQVCTPLLVDTQSRLCSKREEHDDEHSRRNGSVYTLCFVRRRVVNSGETFVSAPFSWYLPPPPDKRLFAEAWPDKIAIVVQKRGVAPRAQICSSCCCASQESGLRKKEGGGAGSRVPSEWSAIKINYQSELITTKFVIWLLDADGWLFVGLREGATGRNLVFRIAFFVHLLERGSERVRFHVQISRWRSRNKKLWEIHLVGGSAEPTRFNK